MTLYDRHLIFAYFRAYVFCLVSLVSLYVVVDLFTNLEDYTQRNQSLVGVLQHIGYYYGYRLAPIFDRLCEPIAVMAAMFTVAWMQRSNELLPFLSAGVSTRRVVRPVLISACAVLGLGVLNQELVIPRFASELLMERDAFRSDKDIPLQHAREPNNIHIHGKIGNRRELVVRSFHCTIPDTIANSMQPISAREARYIPPGTPGEYSGGWLLIGAKPAELATDTWADPTVLEVIDHGRFFLHTTEVDFEALARSNRNWYVYNTTAHLHQLLFRADSNRQAPIAVLFHMRLTRPILGLLLVFLGLSAILRDQNRNVLTSTALCLIMCGLYYGACFLCKYLGDTNALSPALAAWLPVLIFGPLAFVLFDAVHT